MSMTASLLLPMLLALSPQEPVRVHDGGSHQQEAVTPAGAQGNRAAGIGVQLAEGAEGENVRNKIETLLAGILTSDKPTHTM